MVKGESELPNLRDHYNRKENVIQRGLFIGVAILTRSHSFVLLQIVDKDIAVGKDVFSADVFHALLGSGKSVFCVSNAVFSNISSIPNSLHSFDTFAPFCVNIYVNNCNKIKKCYYKNNKCTL